MVDSIEVYGLREYNLTKKKPRILINGVETDIDRLSFFIGVNQSSLMKENESWSKTYTEFGGFRFFPLLLMFLTHIHNRTYRNPEMKMLLSWVFCSYKEITTSNKILKYYWKWRCKNFLIKLEA